MPAASHVSLGVYEPVAEAFRLAAARTAGVVSARAMAVASLLLHAVAVALVSSLARLLLSALAVHRGAHTPRSAQHALCASAAASFFGAHPMRVEAVCWISCQPYLLSCCFCLLCMHCRLLAGSRTAR